MKLKNLAMIAISAMLTSCGNEADIIKNGTMKHYPQAHIGDVLESNFDDTDWSVEEKNGTTYVTFSGEITEELHNKAVKNLNHNFRALIASSHFSSMPSKNPLSITYCKKLKSEREFIKTKLFSIYPWLETEDPKRLLAGFFIEGMNRHLQSTARSSRIENASTINVKCNSLKYLKVDITDSEADSHELEVDELYSLRDNQANKPKKAEFNEIMEGLKTLDSELKKVLKKNSRIFGNDFHIYKDSVAEELTEFKCVPACYPEPRLILTLAITKRALPKYKELENISKRNNILKKQLINFFNEEDARLSDEIGLVNKLCSDFNSESKKILDTMINNREKYKEGYNRLYKLGTNTNEIIESFLKAEMKATRKEFISK